MLKTIREIIAYRQMIVGLVRKDLRGRYKGSVLGFLWTFINPLLQLIIYSFVFGYIYKLKVVDGGPYYLYLFVALIPWIFFSSSVAGGSSSVLAQKDLVKKIYFPREVLPISYVTSCFVNMLLSFIVVFIVAFFAGKTPSIPGLCCLPIVMVIEYLLGLGIAMVSSAVTVYFRDLEHILGIVCMAWMYATPIVYTPNMMTDALKKHTKLLSIVQHVNPMYSVIEAYRKIMFYGEVPKLSTLVEALVLGVAFLFIGLLLFGILKKHFAEEL